MKPRFAGILWLVSLVIFLGALVLTAPLLPERMATHFGTSGVANGWMPRSRHLVLFGFFGLGISSFVVGLLYVVRFFPPGLLNVPHPEYWRSPEHYRKACDGLFHHALWLGTWMVLWGIGIHALIVEANRQAPPHLDGGLMTGLTIGFLLGVAAWVGRLFWFFNRAEPR